MRRLLLSLWLLLAGLQLVLGGTWLVRNVNAIPDYGDTGDYLQLARTLKVDAYRGIAYPAFLAGLNELPGAAGLLRGAGRGGQGTKLKAGVLYLQGLQCLAALGALAYATRVLLARAEPRAGPRWAGRALGALLVLLLFLDPLVVHFGLSIMTDSLALSGSLLYCAALAAFALGTGRRWVSALLLLLGYLLTASIRPEKVWVLGCATIATLVAWVWLERRAAPAERLLSRGRALGVLAIAAAVSATVFLLHRDAHDPGNRWPVRDSLVHSRIVFPHLTEVYDQLSEKTRKRLPPDKAARHDTDSIVGYRMINDATGASGPIRKKDREEAGRTGRRPSVELERREMLDEIAGVVLRERWPVLVLDVLKDAAENVAATFSFYVRLGLLAQDGEVSVADGTDRTWEVLSMLHPESSLRFVVASIVLVLGSTLLAAAALVRRARRGPPLARRRLLLWVPVAAFVLVNACAFALRADMVHIRYMLLAHTLFVALALRGALDWLLAGRGTEAGGTSASLTPAS